MSELDFKPVEASDIPAIAPYLRMQTYRTCDFSIGGMFMWRDYFKTAFSICRNTLFFKIKYFNDLMCFTFPVGQLPPQEALEILERYAADEGLALNFCTVPEAALAVLKSVYKERLTAVPMRDWYDYLYNIEDLRQLKGRKYQGPRNHLNKFKLSYPDYTYNPINKDNIDTVQQFLSENKESILNHHNELAQHEYNKTQEIMNLLMQFDLSGGYLEYEGKVLAVTAGEIINDTLLVHIEKALTAYDGVYQALTNEYLKHNDIETVKYVNREEDVGNEGLRRSKMSYHPVKLLTKYLVTVN